MTGVLRCQALLNAAKSVAAFVRGSVLEKIRRLCHSKRSKKTEIDPSPRPIATLQYPKSIISRSAMKKRTL